MFSPVLMALSTPARTLTISSSRKALPRAGSSIPYQTVWRRRTSRGVLPCPARFLARGDRRVAAGRPSTSPAPSPRKCRPAAARAAAGDAGEEAVEYDRSVRAGRQQGGARFHRLRGVRLFAPGLRAVIRPPAGRLDARGRPEDDSLLASVFHSGDAALRFLEPGFRRPCAGSRRRTVGCPAARLRLRTDPSDDAHAAGSSEVTASWELLSAGSVVGSGVWGANFFRTSASRGRRCSPPPCRRRRALPCCSPARECRARWCAEGRGRGCRPEESGREGTGPPAARTRDTGQDAARRRTIRPSSATPASSISHWPGSGMAAMVKAYPPPWVPLAVPVSCAK